MPDCASVPRATVYVVDYESILTQELIGKIIARYPGARMLLVGDQFSDDMAFPLLRLGVKGLLQHSQLADQLDRAMQSIATGGFWVPRTLLSKFVDSVVKKSTCGTSVASRAGLSRREKEVIQSLLDNLSNKEIASQLNISERTVKFHVSNLLQKFNVRRRADLIILAFQESSDSSSAASTVILHENGRIH